MPHDGQGTFGRRIVTVTYEERIAYLSGMKYNEF